MNCSGGKWYTSSGVCAPTCPAAHPTAGDLYSPTNGACAYADGVCICGACSGGFPIDAGPSDATPPPPTWRCTQMPAGCPFPRPLLGTPCSQPGLHCQYDEPCGCVGATETCTGGYWQGTVKTGCA